ncbi:MAG: ABC1 kinase family protein [Planctomycetota bacterium]|jgi:ubiquinone biosynthesis protein
MTNPLGRTIETARRVRQIVMVLLRFGFDDIVNELQLHRIHKRGAKAITSEDAEQPLPFRVRRALEELGPTYIKIGQILSTRPDLIPDDWVAEFRKLQADLPAAPWDAVEPTLRESFGDELETVFTSIEHEAFAAASIAQVHRAVLEDGSDVVVKILRPGIKATVDADMDILRALASLSERYFKNLGYSAIDVVDQFALEMRRETDLTIEARSTERFARDFESEDMVHFPEVHWIATRHNALTIEAIEGTLLTRLDPTTLSDEERRNIVAIGADVVFRQCLEIGHFHADPHPGNIFYRDDGSLCFIDCGMTGHIDPQTAERIAELVYSVITADLNRVIHVALQLADADQALEIDRRFRADVWVFIDHFRATELSEVRMGALLEEFFDILRKYKQQCPGDLVHLIKAIATIEGVGRQIAPEFDIVGHVRPHVEKLVRRRHGIGAMRRRLRSSLMGYGQLAEEAPLALQELLRRMRSNRMSLHVEHHGLNDLRAVIASASFNIATALVTAAFLVGASVLILADSIDRDNSWVSVLAGAALIVALILGVYRIAAMYITQFRRRRQE